MNNLSIKKFNKSVNNYQCIGPCYPRNKWVLHPNTLEYISNTETSFCPINGITKLDPETKSFYVKHDDKCIIEKDEDNSSAQSDEEITMNAVLPYLGFNLTDFLIQFYNISSYEDGIDWIEKNPTVPLLTKKRIFEIILYIYGDKIDIVDNRTIDFFIEIINKIYMNRIYQSISPYIYADKTKVYVKKNTQVDTEENIINKKMYIEQEFLNLNEISKYLLKYFKNRKEKWDSIQNHIENLVNDLIKYIINIIQHNSK
jgi:hypothetical protein